MATGATDFTKLVPGFDFLQNLFKNAGSALPAMGQWVAPTLDPEELDKRIEQLRTVQFWLEQNARLLAATIQALEVQRMTLNTLKTMNLPLAELRDSMKLRLPETRPATPSAAAPARESAAAPAAPTEAAAAPSAPSAAAGPADPMLWWGALTQQFTELAAGALKESSAGAAKVLGAVRDGSARATKRETPAAASAPARAKPPAAPRKTASRGAAARARKGA